MGRVKESWLNNLTQEDIDKLYEELVNYEHVYVIEEDENNKEEISGTTKE